jgi:hypothetical protein
MCRPENKNLAEPVMVQNMPESGGNDVMGIYTPRGMYTVVEKDWYDSETPQKELQVKVINEKLPVLLADRRIIGDGLLLYYRPTDPFDRVPGYGVTLRVKIKDAKNNHFVGLSVPDRHTDMGTGIIMAYEKYMVITDKDCARFAVYRFDEKWGLDDYERQRPLFPNDDDTAFVERNTREARLEPGTDFYYMPIGIYGDYLFIHAYTGKNPIGLEIYDLEKQETIYIGSWNHTKIEFLDDNTVFVYEFTGDREELDKLPYLQGHSLPFETYSFNLETRQIKNMNTPLTVTL